LRINFPHRSGSDMSWHVVGAPGHGQSLSERNCLYQRLAPSTVLALAVHVRPLSTLPLLVLLVLPLLVLPLLVLPLLVLPLLVLPLLVLPLLVLPLLVRKRLVCIYAMSLPTAALLDKHAGEPSVAFKRPKHQHVASQTTTETPGPIHMNCHAFHSRRHSAQGSHPPTSDS
jgi:hypothetical protein